MQGQRNTIDSFPENFDIDQGCVSNNIGMSESTSWNNVLNPVDSQLSNYVASSGEATYVNAIGHDVQSFSGWDMGETSSRLILQNQVNNDGMKVECDWSPSFSVHAGAGPSSEERQFEPTNVLFPGMVNIGLSGNQITSGPLYLQSSRSNHNPQTESLNSGYVGNCSNGRQGMVAGVPNIYKPGGLETGQISSSSSSDNVGSSSGISGHALEESNCGLDSLGSWGSSCKRKALEGTPGHSFAASSSSCFPQAENGVWQTGTVHYNASSSLNLSTPPWKSFGVGPPQQLNPIIGVGMRGIASDTFPAVGVTGIAENHMRNFGRRASSGHQQESMPLNLSTGSASHSNVFSIHQSPRPVPYMDSLDVRSTAVVSSSSSAPQSQSHAMRASVMSTNVPPFPWNRSSTSRSGTSSSSLLSGERGAASMEEPNLRSISRNNVDHPMFLPAMEIRNMAQDPTSWSLATGNVSIPGNVQSTPRIGPSSSVQPLHTPAWISHHNPQTQNQQRLSAFAHWSFFPSVDSDTRGHSGHFPPTPSGPSASLQETVMPSGGNTRGRGHHQPYPRTALMDRRGDDVLGFPHSLRVLAADIEGRHRLISEIRQVLNAMRRGENLRIEDYMLFDPFIYHGMAETHDRHRDMRLDVDNMSYEELLALEERIGDVSTGLSEETILKCMKQRRYVTVTTINPPDLEPCCICQEEYADGDDLGTLDCGHDFHTNCIKQWLNQKNLCPICKTTALAT